MTSIFDKFSLLDPERALAQIDAALAGADGGSQSSKTIALTADQINHLFSAPLTLMAAPGAGKAIVPTLVEWYCRMGSSPFGSPASSAGNLILMYGGLTGLPIVGDSGAFELFVAAAAIVPVFIGAGSFGSVPLFIPNPPGGAIAGVDSSLLDNQAILLTNSVSDYVTAGVVGSVGITSGNAGTGYAPGDTGQISNMQQVDPTFANVTYEVDTVDGDGGVLTFHLTSSASGSISTGNTTNNPSGGGSGFQVDVLSVTPGDGSGSITITYKEVTLP